MGQNVGFDIARLSRIAELAIPDDPIRATHKFASA
jgi:hypothetical protein